MSAIIVSGAYGRDYKTATAVKLDWEAGKDFVIRSYGPDMGRYLNKDDCEGNTVSIRFDNDRKVVLIKD